MTETAPSFPTLLQRFFVDHLRQQRAVSPCTVTAYRDTFKLLLAFAKRRIGKSPTHVTLPDLNADLILAFLDHIEHERANGVRSRDARLSAIRVFMHDLQIVFVIEFVARKDAELVSGPEERDRNHENTGKRKCVALCECKLLCHVRNLCPEQADPARWLLKGPGTVAITAQSKTSGGSLLAPDGIVTAVVAEV